MLGSGRSRADPKRCADYTESAYELLKENAVPEELRTPILTLYFETKFFCDTAKRFDGNYYAFFDRKDRDLSYTLFCANPADLIQTCTGNALASVFFSATLLPFAFYTQALGARREEDLFIKIPSPFPPENLPCNFCGRRPDHICKARRILRKGCKIYYADQRIR